MSIEKGKEEIVIRIGEMQNQLTIIDDAMKREMAKPFFQRLLGVCRILDIERKVFSAKIEELKWVLGDQASSKMK